MHVGHFAVGFIGKRIDPQLSLGTLVLAAMLADFLWCLFMLAGVEEVRFTTGMGAANYFFGLGLWANIPATIIVEGGLWLLAIALYVRSTRPRNRLAHFVFWPVVLLLTLLWLNNITGPPPPNPRMAPIFSLVYFSLVVAWAYWINRLRPTS